MREFARFSSFSSADLPDPHAVATFERSKVSARTPDRLVEELMALRTTLPRRLEVRAWREGVVLRRGGVSLTAEPVLVGVAL